MSNVPCSSQAADMSSDNLTTGSDAATFVIEAKATTVATGVDISVRSYHGQLIDAALERNSIIYMPAVNDRSFITVQCVQHLNAAERQLPLPAGGRPTVIVAGNRLLVHQQVADMRRWTPLRCSVYTGDQPLAGWQRADWQQQLDEHDVLVIAAPVLLNALCRGQIRLGELNALLFVGCHTGTSKPVAQQVMLLYRKLQADAPRPRIVVLIGQVCADDGHEVPAADSAQLPWLADLEATFEATVAVVQMQPKVPMPGFPTRKASLQQYAVASDMDANVIEVSVSFATHVLNSCSIAVGVVKF